MKFIFCLTAFCFVLSSGKANNIASIYERLTDAVGDYRTSLPTLEIRAGKRQVATYSRLNNKIYLDQAAIDICDQFGADAESAIAFLLGHELTHFYQNHDWQESNFLSLTANFDKHMAEEEEADTYGAFVSHLAGFETIEIIPDLLDKIYDAYVKDEADLANYPSLAQRKSVAKQVCKKVSDLIQIYETGNYLFALQQLEEAYYCYDYVSKFIRCKEIFNNLGATALYAASTITSHNEQGFIYPIYLDTDLPIRAPGNFTKEQLLKIAVEKLSKATQYDPSYYTAFINLACAHEMSGNLTSYQTLNNQLKNLPIKEEQKMQLLILEGISAAKLNREEEAFELFQLAKKKMKYSFIGQLAKQNIQALKDKAVKLKSVPSSIYIQDEIGSYNLITNSPQQAKRLIFDKNGFQVHITKSLSADYAEIGFKSKLLITHSIHEKTRKGMGVGNDLSELESAYRDGVQNKQFAGGHWIVLYDKGLIFQIDNRKIVAWGIFMLE